MKKLKCVTKPKNRNGYYFTPTVDSKTKWIPLGEDCQAALAKYHLTMHGDARPHTVNEGMDLSSRDGEDVFDFPGTSMPPYSSLSEATRRNYESVV
jgi:hypothetical protein